MKTREQVGLKLLDDNLRCTCGTCPVHPGSAAPPVGQEAKVYQAVLDGRLLIDNSGRILRGSQRAEHRKGSHWRVTVRVQGVLTNTLAHRLVWFHFCGPIPAGLQVNHIDGNGLNNMPENLELTTPAKNSYHRYHTLRRRNLTQEGRAKGQSNFKASNWGRLENSYLRERAIGRGP